MNAIENGCVSGLFIMYLNSPLTPVIQKSLLFMLNVILPFKYMSSRVASENILMILLRCVIFYFFIMKQALSLHIQMYLKGQYFLSKLMASTLFILYSFQRMNSYL